MPEYRKELALMGYCLACGMNRKTLRGMCKECRRDDAVKKDMQRKSDRAKAMRDVARSRRAERSEAS